MEEAMIETARLVLCPMRAEDTAALLPLFADPRVMAAFASDPFDLRQTEQWVQRNLAHQKRYGYGLWAVILKANGVLIGNCGLTHIDVDGAPEIELGYDLRSDYWGQGLATEAASAVRDHAFGVLGIARLVSLIRRGNRASQRVAEKAGMRRVRSLARGGVEYWLYACARDEEARHTGE
jgi:RimJ/RimL family protein N-acetyltransferase